MGNCLVEDLKHSLRLFSSDGKAVQSCTGIPLGAAVKSRAVQGECGGDSVGGLLYVPVATHVVLPFRLSFWTLWLHR